MQITPNQIIEAKFYSLPFKELVKNYPELNAFAVSINPLKFDLGNPEVLSRINQILYKEVLDLNLEVSPSHLIPSLGIRHAYCDFISSILKSDNPMIEVGTGAVAAISLILAKKYHRNMISTEIDPDSLESARRNIVRNQLEDSIELLLSEGQILDDLIPKGKYSALLCYPPIYEDDFTRLKKIKGWKGTKYELIGGGKDGLNFSKELIGEALDTKGVDIELISLMLMNINQVKSILSTISKNITHKITQINAGTRKRFILVISKES